MSSLRLVNPTAISDQILTKQQLAAMLDRSPRWVEMKTREGMPSIDPTRRFPARRYRLSDVQAWLAGGEKIIPVDRVGRLEAQVAELTTIVSELQRRAG